MSKFPLTAVASDPTPLEIAEAMSGSRPVAEVRAAFTAAIAGPNRPVARNAYGCYLMRIENYAAAAEQFRLLLHEASADPDGRWQSVAAANLSGAFRAAGETELAARYQQLAISRGGSGDAHRCSDTSDESPMETPLSACDLANRANDAILAGDLPLAERLIRRSLLMETGSGNLAGEADDWGSLGIVLAMRRQFVEGFQCLWRAYWLHRQLGDERSVGIDLMNLADLVGRLGKIQSAESLLRRAIKCFEKADAGHSASRARIVLAELQRITAVRQRDPLLN